jgi:hypothetical protein
LGDGVAVGSAPLGGSLKVTGYNKITLDQGSLGPVTVIERGQKAVAILAALAELHSAPPGSCHETSNAFSISRRTEGTPYRLQNYGYDSKISHRNRGSTATIG